MATLGDVEKVENYLSYLPRLDELIGYDFSELAKDVRRIQDPELQRQIDHYRANLQANDVPAILSLAAFAWMLLKKAAGHTA